MHEAQPVAQTPAKQLAIACRQQKPAGRKCRRRADQCHEAPVGLGNRMPEECDLGGIGRDLAQMLDDAGRSLRDGIAQLALAGVAVDALAQPVASGNVVLSRRPDLIAREFYPERLAVDLRQRFAAVEAEIGLQAQ